MNIDYRSIAACCVVAIGCMEVPDPGAAGDEDGGRPLLLALPPPPEVSVQGGCHVADGGPAWGGDSWAEPVHDGGWASAGGSAAIAEGAGAGWPAPTDPGDLRISEFMANPAALSDTDGEWFELYNARDTSFELSGCEVAEGGGPGAFIEGPLAIHPGDYVAVARRPSPGFVPAAVVAFSLKNTADSVVFRCGAVEIDRVDYGPGYPLSAGASAQLDPDALDRPAVDDWCLGREPYAGDLGTPGRPNLPCEPVAADADAGSD